MSIVTKSSLYVLQHASMNLSRIGCDELRLTRIGGLNETSPGPDTLTLFATDLIRADFTEHNLKVTITIETHGPSREVV